MDIRELLEKTDKKLFKVRSADPDCQLSNIIPKKKETKYQLKNKTAHRLDIKTERFTNVFVNRLVFRYNLWSFFYLYTVCLMYFYLFICIQYVLCIFRLPTADVTEDMSFYLRRNKDWLIDWLIDWLSGRRSKAWCSCRVSCCFAHKGWIHLQHTRKAVTFNRSNLRATSTRIQIYFFKSEIYLSVLALCPHVIGISWHQKRRF